MERGQIVVGATLAVDPSVGSKPPVRGGARVYRSPATNEIKDLAEKPIRQFPVWVTLRVTIRRLVDSSGRTHAQALDRAVADASAAFGLPYAAAPTTPN